MTAPGELPDDIAELKAIFRAQQDQNARLEALVASFKKALFGAKFEKIDPAQYELELEGIETAIAQEGLAQIQLLYRIEKDLRGQSADRRRAARQEHAKPIIDAFELWLAQSRARVSAKSPTGEALKYIAKYWEGLCGFLDDGRIEVDNNPVERTIRPIALNHKNALFAGHEVGAQNWAVIASLIETCKLNGIEPHGYLSAVLTAIAGGHKRTDIKVLLPWNFAKPV